MNKKHFIRESKLKHIRITSDMSVALKFKLTSRELFRKQINYYEPIVRISEIFKEVKTK